nr:expansin-like A2 [Ipomoea batatas]
MAAAVISYLLLLLLVHSTFATAFSDASDHDAKNLAIRVEESSESRRYLAIQFLNLGARTEIVAVDVAEVGSLNWNFMSRKNEGESGPAIWETNRVPSGALQFRVVVTAGFDGKWYWASKVMPEDWKSGEVYDTGLCITDIDISMETTDYSFGLNSDQKFTSSICRLASRDSPPPSGFHQQTAAWLRQSPPPATAQHSRSRSNAAALRPPQQAATSPPSAQHQPAALRPPISSPVVVGRSTIKY